MKKAITSIILACVMVVGVSLYPASSAQAATPIKEHQCNHCRATFGYYIGMKFMWSQDNLKCPQCGPIKAISYFECKTCNDCSAVVCPNGHSWEAKG